MAVAVQASDLDWTAVRFPRVVARPSTGSYRSGLLKLGPWNKVASGDVAAFVIACLTDPATVRTAPMVAAGGSRANPDNHPIPPGELGRNQKGTHHG